MASDTSRSETINYGLRFFAASVLLISTYVSLRSVFAVPEFERIFSEMLEGIALPTVTLFLIRFYPSSAVIPLGILILGSSVLFASKRPQMPFFVAGCCLLLQMAVSIIYFTGLFAPLLQIVGEMSSH